MFDQTTSHADQLPWKPQRWQLLLERVPTSPSNGRIGSQITKDLCSLWVLCLDDVGFVLTCAVHGLSANRADQTSRRRILQDWRLILWSQDHDLLVNLGQRSHIILVFHTLSCPISLRAIQPAVSLNGEGGGRGIGSEMLSSLNKFVVNGL